MYNIKNLLQQKPTTLSELVRQILFTLSLAGVIALDEKLILAIVMIVSLALSALTSDVTVAKANVTQTGEEPLDYSDE